MNEIKLDDDAEYYLEEFIQKLSEVETLVLGFSRDISKKKNLLKEISHTLHSLKGTAGSYGFELLSILCHKMEDLIAVSEFSRNEKLVDELLKIKDLMLKLSEIYKKNDLPSLELFRRHYGISYSHSHTPYVTIFENSSEVNLPAVEKKIKVLVCESSKIISRKYCEVLSEFNVEVSIARDGYEALGRMLKEHFDVLLTSLRVPLIDAIGLVAVLESIPNPNKNIKSVIVTSSKNLNEKLKKDKIRIIEKSVNFENDLKVSLESMIPYREKAKSSQNLNPYKVLLIDDSPEIHKLMSASIKKFNNIKLVNCYDPLQAEDFIIREKPDIILLDVQMPQISGEELFVRLQMRNLLKNIIVIFLTALDSQKDINRLSSMGPRAIFKKPFTPKELAQQIFNILISKAS